jgi:hypothetical protein
VSPESLDPELQLYQEWDVSLTDFFEGLDRVLEASAQGGQPSKSEDVEIRSYRNRVGQDLRAFQEKLSNIMESEKSGQ